MAARRLLLVALFLGLVSEVDVPYDVMASPFRWAYELLFEALPWKIRLFDHLTGLALVLALSGADGKGPRVKPMQSMLTLSAVTIVIWFIYGVARGGGAWQASWQVYLMLSGVLLAFAAGAAFRTPEQWTAVGKVIMAAAAYRAFMCWLFYLLYIHTVRIRQPEYITSHDDTVLWVVAILMVGLRAIETRSLTSRAKCLAFFLFLSGAILFNQRRLAWVSLAMGAFVVVLLIPPGRAKRKVMRVAYVLAPIVAIYAVVGWGRTERIFKPLQSFATVSTQEDASTKARNVENLGLIATSNSSSMLMGTGWGHPYVEVSNKYSIARYFPLWQYIPHNSILGLLAYTGVLGFCGYWLVFPTAMFLNSRMARLGKTQPARRVGIIGAASLVVCANQFYGDMGIYYLRSVYMLALGYAVALRLPLLAGAWPAPKPLRARTPAALPLDRPAAATAARSAEGPAAASRYPS